MKKIIILVLLMCFVTIGCVKSPGGHVTAVKMPVESQKYIGSFRDNVNIYRKHGDTIEIQREQQNSFDVYNLDMSTAGMKYQYTAEDNKGLLYYRQLSGGRTLEVKRLGNSEEDNVLMLKGKKETTIARGIGYSDGSMVSASPSERYIIYCAAEGMVNTYGLYAYDTQTESTVQLIGAANEELLNDLEWNLNWSPLENYIAVSDKVVVDVTKGTAVAEISASTMVWSPSGSKAAYIKQDGSGDKTLCVADLAGNSSYEVFVCNQDEFLPGYIVWSGNENKLAVAIADRGNNENSDIYEYKAIYSLDLTSKEAKRIDTALTLPASMIAQLESMHYNDAGSLLSFTCGSSTGTNLHVYNMNTGDYKVFFNVEYLHNENNESYACSSKNKLYFVQGGSLMELGEEMEAKVVKNTESAIDDIYISQDGSSMIVVESREESRVIRQLTNFSTPI